MTAPIGIGIRIHQTLQMLDEMEPEGAARIAQINAHFRDGRADIADLLQELDGPVVLRQYLRWLDRQPGTWMGWHTAENLRWVLMEEVSVATHKMSQAFSQLRAPFALLADTLTTAVLNLQLRWQAVTETRHRISAMHTAYAHRRRNR